MRHKNIVLLEGRIGERLEYKRTKEGREYVKFWIEMRSFDKDFRDVTETKADIYIPIVVFDHNLLQYMRRVGAKSGNLISLFGRVNTYKREIKGEIVRSVNVVVRDLHIIKTQKQESNGD